MLEDVFQPLNELTVNPVIAAKASFVLGQGDHGFDHAVKTWRKVYGVPSRKGKANTKSAGRSLDAFKSAHDRDTIIRAKIDAALSELGDAWEYESEFVKRSGVNYNDLGNYREAYEGHWVTLKREGKRVWAGTESFAAELRELV